MKPVFRVAISLGILGVLLIVLPWAELKEAAGRLRPLVWVSVLLAFLTAHRLGVEKWRLLLRAGRLNLRRTDAVRCYAAGLFANICLPTIVGGDVLRAALAAKAAGRAEAAVVGGLADRVVDMMVLGTLLLVGAILTAGSIPSSAMRITALTVAAGGTGLAILVFVLAFRPLSFWPRRVRRRIGRGLVALRGLRRNLRVAVTAAVISLVMQAGFVMMNAWIGASIGIRVPLAVWLFAWPAAKLSGLLPVSLGGLGVRDATLGALLAMAGVPLSTGVIASLIWQSVLIAGALTAGLIWYAAGGGQERHARV